MEIQSCFFDKTKDGQEVTKYVLTNDHGHTVSIITFGGIITEICVPNKEGVIENVVLGYDNMRGYYEESQYFGCITGRFAGRIDNALFTLNGKEYPLAKNDGEHCLHGGNVGFSKVLWNATEIHEKDYLGLALNYISEDLEEGFPGTLDTTVVYKWNNQNELTIQYIATTDQETPITLTNHTYFNLSGSLGQPILDHLLQIDANRFVEVSANCIPCGIIDVENTPFDFRTPKLVGQDIQSEHQQIINGNGYDHPFILNKQKNPQAILLHEHSGRKLEVSTDEDCLVVYSGNYLTDEIKLFDKTKASRRCAICLETQYYPDNMHFDLVPTISLKPNELYRHKTIFKFSIS